MAMVDNFVIHDETKRRRGWGRELYSDWESTLPHVVSVIFIRAKSPEAECFWGSIGFKRLFSEPANAFEMNGGVGMVKHLNQPQ